MGAQACHCHGQHICGLGAQQELRPSAQGQDIAKEGITCAESAEVIPRSTSSKQAQLALSDPGLVAPPAAVSLSRQCEGDGARAPHKQGASARAKQAADAAAAGIETSNLSSLLAASYLCRELRELQDPDLPSFGDSRVVRMRRQHTFRTGAFYDGQWLGNERDGQGTQTWPDGAKYEGQWRNNKAAGKGNFVHSDGDSYIGEWNSNLAHGCGIYLHREGSTYRGEFETDLQHGFGIETWPDEAKFTGVFMQGKKTGQGVYQWPDRSQYAGEWSDNQINGLGTYTGADGRHFVGSWRSSSMHGCGRHKWVDGRCYDGQYSRDHKDGFGVFTWADGRRYEGYWARGQQDGLGRLKSTSGEVRHARWICGERIEWLDLEAKDAKTPLLQQVAEAIESVSQEARNAAKGKEAKVCEVEDPTGMPAHWLLTGEDIGIHTSEGDDANGGVRK